MCPTVSRLLMHDGACRASDSLQSSVLCGHSTLPSAEANRPASATVCLWLVGAIRPPLQSRYPSEGRHAGRLRVVLLASSFLACLQVESVDTYKS